MVYKPSFLVYYNHINNKLIQILTSEDYIMMTKFKLFSKGFNALVEAGFKIHVIDDEGTKTLVEKPKHAKDELEALEYSILSFKKDDIKGFISFTSEYSAERKTDVLEVCNFSGLAEEYFEEYLDEE